MKTTIINWLLVLFVSLSWGASFMFTRLVVEEISPSHLVSIRLLLAALLLGPLFINKEEFLKSKVLNSLDEFKKKSDLIISNRFNEELEDVSEKVFTRDLYGRD